MIKVIEIGRWIPNRRVWLRRLFGYGGMATGCTALAAVITLFGDASTMPWLQPTPANLALMKRCDEARGSAERRACAEAVVAEATTAPLRRLASSDAVSEAAPN